jgi:hypothetical protein
MMARLKSHLPSLGVLALAVVVAAVAYSVYSDHGSSGSDGVSGTEVGGLVVAPKDTTTTHRSPFPKATKRAGHAAVHRVPAAGSARHGEGARGAAFGGESGLSAGPVLQPEQFHPRRTVTPRKSPSRRNSPDDINRELRRLIDGPKGRRPAPAPRRPSPRRPVAPTPTLPRPDAPVGGTPTAPPPTVDPGAGTTPTTTPPDPDAGLDDTPVGGLDPTDLGEPVDETDTGAAPVPGTGAPTDTGTDTGAGTDAPIDIGPDTGG